MLKKSDIPQPEFSRPLAIDKIPQAGSEQHLVAKESERQALAERFGLLDLPRLEAELKVRSGHGDQIISVSGTMIADVVQQCVVTLEPLPSHIEQEIEIQFAPPELVGTGAGPSDVEEEDFEPILNGFIDLGELVAQNLGIALDPYPRKAGVEYVDALYGEEDKKQPGPLAQLVNLKKKPKDSR